MGEQETGNIYAVFWLYRVAPEWRRLPAAERDAARDAFAAALESNLMGLTLRGAYSMVGLRHDADLMLWLHGPDLGQAQDLAAALRRTPLGGYLEEMYTYTGLVPRSRYAPEHRPAFTKGAAPRTYLSIYPFVKTQEWYLIPFEQRRALMAEHGKMGQAHSAMPEVRIDTGAGGHHRGTAVAEAPAAAPVGTVLANTIHSFGLGDQEFVVAFESEDPAALEKMVEDLRAAEVRRYTAIDTPVFLGRRKEIRAALADLG
ncbi:MAG TPA: chlorite dismutase family protein [Chloroflexota bacterium]|nr:chlorite dismutase family protein [Chloroflexota bacterium]